MISRCIIEKNGLAAVSETCFCFRLSCPADDAHNTIYSHSSHRPIMGNVSLYSKQTKLVSKGFVDICRKRMQEKGYILIIILIIQHIIEFTWERDLQHFGETLCISSAHTQKLEKPFSGKYKIHSCIWKPPPSSI